jgi:5-methyltetrahydropteroyltriglutamate--homocysteine methyltransferase
MSRPEDPSSPFHRDTHAADVRFDGGNLDCGNGLLLLIRRHIDPMHPGQLLEILSTEPTVEQDLPAWCRLTGNELVSAVREGGRLSFLVCKGSFREGRSRRDPTDRPREEPSAVVAVVPPRELPSASEAPEIPPLAVMGIGSWPRAGWMLRAIREHLQGRMPDDEFRGTVEDAIRLAVDAQLRAGVDVVTDGEQSRDSYAGFVGAILDNCQLIPLTDLLAMVDDPEEFERELRALDVPAQEVRHPVPFGPLGRSRPLAVRELDFVRTLTDRPVKVALPGPYLLTRTMWLECLADLAYTAREHLARDVVRVLREEVHFLLAHGAACVQLDEPVLTEVVFSGPKNRRSFMCGALSEKKSVAEELDFAAELIDGVVAGLPPSRIALHICRGNWTRDENLVLAGDYRPLLPLLKRLNVGTFLLELCTPRAGELEVLRELPDDRRIGVGSVNPKTDTIEPVDEIVGRVRNAIRLFGRDRVLLHPDCGFATFADNPVNSAKVAEAKLRTLSHAAEIVRAGVA